MKKQLEEYINQHGLAATIRHLEVICDEKAESIKERDPKAAKRWYVASVKLYQLSAKKYLRSL